MVRKCNKPVDMKSLFLVLVLGQESGSFSESVLLKITHRLPQEDIIASAPTDELRDDWGAPL